MFILDTEVEYKGETNFLFLSSLAIIPYLRYTRNAVADDDLMTQETELPTPNSLPPSSNINETDKKNDVSNKDLRRYECN